MKLYNALMLFLAQMYQRTLRDEVVIDRCWMDNNSAFNRCSSVLDAEIHYCDTVEYKRANETTQQCETTVT